MTGVVVARSSASTTSPPGRRKAIAPSLRPRGLAPGVFPKRSGDRLFFGIFSAAFLSLTCFDEGEDFLMRLS